MDLSPPLGTFTLYVAWTRKFEDAHVQASLDQSTIKQDLATHNSPVQCSIIRQGWGKDRTGGLGLSSAFIWALQLQRVLGCSKLCIGWEL